MKTSVTKFINTFFPKFDVPVVIAKMMASPNWPNSKYFGKTLEEIAQEWSIKGQNSASLGTNMHSCIEKHINEFGWKYRKSVQQMPHTHEYSNFIQFIKDTKKGKLTINNMPTVWDYKPYKTEFTVIMTQEHYKNMPWESIKGIIDAIFINPKTGKYVVVDWKRCEKIEMANPYQNALEPISRLTDCNFNHYSLQLNLYAFMLKHTLNMEIERMILVNLLGDSYTVYDVDDMSHYIKYMITAI